MWSILSLILIFLLFAISCTIFFIVAVSDEKVRSKSAEELLNALPKNISNKWIVRYNVGRPQGRFLKMKSFQGIGVIYIEENYIKFEDILDNESHSFLLNNSKISWVEDKVNGIKNAFKIVDLDKTMFFYVDRGISIVNTIDGNESTAELYAKLKTFKKKSMNSTRVELESEL